MNNNSIHNDRDESSFIWGDFKTGSSRAFLSLYDQYIDALFLFGSNFSKDENLIKDCIHDLFIDLYRYREKLSEARNVRYYLYSSLKRKIIKEKQKREGVRFYDPDLLSLIEKEETPSTEYFMILNEEQENQHHLILQALNKLSKHQQEILFLRFNQELDYSEIADLFHISVGTVRTLVYRALKMLRASLKDSKHFFQFFFSFYNDAIPKASIV